MHLQRGPEDAQTVLVEVEKLKQPLQKRVGDPGQGEAARRNHPEHGCSSR